MSLSEQVAELERLLADRDRAVAEAVAKETADLRAELEKVAREHPYEECRKREAFERFLLHMVETKGTIVSSNECSVVEIAAARACDRFYVDSRAYGYVIRPRQRPTPPAGETSEHADSGSPGPTGASHPAEASPFKAAAPASASEPASTPPRVCPRCGGSGMHDPRHSDRLCVACEGDGRVEAKGEESSPTCRHYDEDESGAQVGDACGKPAKWLNCQWVGGMPVCDTHKCRCNKPIAQPTPVTGEAAGGLKVIRCDDGDFAVWSDALNCALAWDYDQTSVEMWRDRFAAHVARAEAKAREEALEEAARIADRNDMSGWGIAQAIRALGAGEGKR